jgi:ParB family transcriptional regulator, chromosome partitioning protein
VTERKRGLGRGLGALIPTAPPGEHRSSSPVDVFFARVDGAGNSTSTLDRASGSPLLTTVSRETSPPASAADLVPVQGATFAELDIDAIRPNPRQPRQVFDEDEMAELAASIAEVGLLQPVVVRETSAGEYELVMGERRWRASRRAGLTRIPAIVRDTSDDVMLRDALLENLHRTELNPLEEAAAYQQLLDDFGCTHDELAARIQRSRPQITNTLRLLKLPPVVQRRVAARVLSAGHARALLALPDTAAQERLAQRIVAEGLSVRAVEEIVMLGGQMERPTKQPRAPKPVAPRLGDIAAMLSERLDTRVKVALGRTRGRVVIEFASIDDLERIVSSLAATDGDQPRA